MTPLSKISVYVIAAMAMLNVVWMFYAGFSLVWADLFSPFAGIGILLAISYFYTVYRPIEDFAVVTWWTAVLIAFSVVAAISSYLFASLNFPLKDSYFAAFDRAIGFDWLAALAFVNQYEWLGKVSTFFYFSSLPLVAISLIFLSFTKQHKKVELFITALILACLVTLMASGPLAALGPYVYFQPSFELYRNFAPAVMPQGADSQYISHLMELRDGSMRILELGKSEGLIVFPSFHTVMSVLMILALRDSGRIIFTAGALYNGLILLSVPLDGGHYLADMVAGGLLAVTVWYGLAALDQLISEKRLRASLRLPSWGTLGELAGKAGRWAQMSGQIFSHLMPCRVFRLDRRGFFTKLSHAASRIARLYG